MVTSLDPRSALEKATDAVNGVAKTVRTTTESVAAAIADSRRPGGILDQLSRLARSDAIENIDVLELCGKPYRICLRVFRRVLIPAVLVLEGEPYITSAIEVVRQ